MCGIFGIRSEEREVARVTYFGLFALQHRGQEAAGIAVSDEGRLTVLRDLGLVAQVFDEQKLQALTGQVAIGHTRYSTTGSNAWTNVQPLVQHGRARTVALGHNGNLTNALRAACEPARVSAPRHLRHGVDRRAAAHDPAAAARVADMHGSRALLDRRARRRRARRVPRPARDSPPLGRWRGLSSPPRPPLST